MPKDSFWQKKMKTKKNTKGKALFISYGAEPYQGDSVHK
jgi:hypothetical protein